MKLPRGGGEAVVRIGALIRFFEFKSCFCRSMSNACTTAQPDFVTRPWQPYKLKARGKPGGNTPSLSNYDETVAEMAIYIMCS